MRKKILFFALAAIGLCSIDSCDRFKGPQEILEKANKVLYEEGDVDTYFTYLYLPGESTNTDMSEVKANVKRHIDSLKTANGGIESIRLQDVGSLDDIANYNMTVKYGNGKLDSTLVQLYKKEGVWKINNFSITQQIQQRGLK